MKLGVHYIKDIKTQSMGNMCTVVILASHMNYSIYDQKYDNTAFPHIK